MHFIPYGHQAITKEDVGAVVEVLTSDWLTQGPAIEQFERTVAEYCGAKYAVAVNSATAALHIACLAAGLGPDDYLWTSPNTFVASANCGLYCGSKVDFVDVAEDTYNMDTTLLAEKLQVAAKQSKLPKVLIPVHFSGYSCDMEQISMFAKQYGCTVIEDASHAIGGRYQQKPIGNCQFSDMTVFSFHPVKIVTTGEGGMVLTNRQALYEALIRLRSHGITRNPQHMIGEAQGGWDYQQIELGFNYRMTDLQAALGTSQMQRIDMFVERRRQLVLRYQEKLAELPLQLPVIDEENPSAWHLYVVQVDENAAYSRKDVFDTLRQHNIGVNVHYIPVHTQPYYQRLGFTWGDFPQAEQYYRRTLTLPLYYGLTLEEQDFVVETLKKALMRNDK